MITSPIILFRLLTDVWSWFYDRLSQYFDARILVLVGFLVGMWRYGYMVAFAAAAAVLQKFPSIGDNGVAFAVRLADGPFAFVLESVAQLLDLPTFALMVATMGAMETAILVVGFIRWVWGWLVG